MKLQLADLVSAMRRKWRLVDNPTVTHASLHNKLPTFLRLDVSDSFENSSA